MVLGTALFDKAPFKNVIVNGLVLAQDGKKMSKRLKNYPDPEVVVNAHGAGDQSNLEKCARLVTYAHTHTHTVVIVSAHKDEINPWRSCLQNLTVWPCRHYC